jgi:hypothetical protein
MKLIIFFGAAKLFYSYTYGTHNELHNNTTTNNNSLFKSRTIALYEQHATREPRTKYHWSRLRVRRSCDVENFQIKFWRWYQEMRRRAWLCLRLKGVWS